MALPIDAFTLVCPFSDRAIVVFTPKTFLGPSFLLRHTHTQTHTQTHTATLEHSCAGAECWTLRKVDQEYLENLKCAGEGWKSAGPIVLKKLHRVKEDRNILHKLNWSHLA
jgi:hypothetical protein